MKSMKDLSVKSPLDVDFYKYTMAYFVWKFFPNVIVKYEFKNRTKDVPLGHLLLPLQMELDNIRRFYKYQEDELEFISSLKIFPEEFIRFLALIELPEIHVEKDGNELKIYTEGLWMNAIWWETMVLSATNYMCFKDLDALTGKDHVKTGDELLSQKIEVLKNNPEIRFSEFGTRRRFSYEWQKHVVERLKDEVPKQIIGTSNVLLAKELDLKPSGTMAHEIFMIGSRLFGDTDEDIRSSHGKILDMWYELYGEKMSIALTDTFGSKFFFEDFGIERAQKWKGLRQDSGSPIDFAKTQLEYYKNLGIDSHKKLFVPSDGLTCFSITYLTNTFSKEINVNAGWGTNLSNDCGYKTLSLVMKATEANGQGLVKLSDNVNKATGKTEDVERFKRIFGYTNISSQELTY